MPTNIFIIYIWGGYYWQKNRKIGPLVAWREGNWQMGGTGYCLYMSVHMYVQKHGYTWGNTCVGPQITMGIISQVVVSIFWRRAKHSAGAPYMVDCLTTEPVNWLPVSLVLGLQSHTTC